MDPRTIVSEIESLREREGPVEYIDAFQRDRPFGRVTFIVVATRADLGAVVAGGRIKRLFKKYGPIRVVSEDEILVRRYRLEKARRRARALIPRASPLFEAFREYPRVDRDSLKDSVSASVTVAYSGGADSKASSRILEFSGAEVERLYVRMPRPISISVPADATRIVDAPPDAENIVREALAGKYHPCGRCSATIERAVLESASNDVVVFGHLLPTGVASLRVSKRLVRSLPASLAMSKADTVYLATNGTMDYDYKFGCMLLHQLHKKYPRMRMISMRRVVREAVAGVLLPSQAYELIKSIFA